MLQGSRQMKGVSNSTARIKQFGELVWDGGGGENFGRAIESSYFDPMIHSNLYDYNGQ